MGLRFCSGEYLEHSARGFAGGIVLFLIPVTEHRLNSEEQKAALQKIPVLLIPGFGGTTVDVYSLLWRLNMNRPDLQIYVVSYDTHGTGLKKTAQALSKELSLLSEQNTSSQPLVLIGHSMGATVASLLVHEMAEPNFLEQHRNQKPQPQNVNSISLGFPAIHCIALDPVQDGIPSFGSRIPVIGQILSGAFLVAGQKNALDMRAKSPLFKRLFTRPLPENIYFQDLHAGKPLHEGTKNPVLKVMNKAIRRFADFTKKEKASIARSIAQNPYLEANQRVSLDSKKCPRPTRACQYFEYLYYADVDYEKFRACLMKNVEDAGGFRNGDLSDAEWAKLIDQAFRETYLVFDSLEHMGIAHAEESIEAVIKLIPN